ncbi:MAG TPA: hypothetical protein VNV37_08155 [Solirubrobacteraceae bacterium]|nr:hypothetical protein [Solirubrobacteraceae bacterium]
MLALMILAGRPLASADAATVSGAAPRSCAHALTLERQGRFNEAERAYLSELAKDTPPCASQGLASLIGGSSPCAYGSFLERLGRTSAAEEEYRRALIRDPGLACARSGLGALDAGEAFASLRGDVATIATDTGELAIHALEILATLAIAWYVALLVVGRIPGASAALRHLPPARRALGVQVIFEKFEDEAVTPKMGAGVIALVRGAMRKRLPQSEEELDQVTGQSSIAEGLAGLSALSPQLGTLAAIWTMVERLLPRIRVSASGVLQPVVDDQGWGLSLAVRRNDEYSAMTTLRSGPLGYGSRAKPDQAESASAYAFTRMAVPAAAWLDHKLAEMAGTSVSTTGDALSYAYFRAALHWEREGDLDWARLLYMSALRYDANNIGALANLAVLELREQEDNKQEDEQGFLRLQRALEAIEGDGAGRSDGDSEQSAAATEASP